jgi:small subunit ribosomal protein S8
MQDSLSDFFTRIRNACLIRCQTVQVPSTKINQKIIQILIRHGFIQCFENCNHSLICTLKYNQNQPLITQIRRLSRPGCRMYVAYSQIPQICGQLGILFISTSRGILTDREARQFGLGGELLGFVC